MCKFVGSGQKNQDVEHEQSGSKWTKNVRYSRSNPPPGNCGYSLPRYTLKVRCSTAWASKPAPCAYARVVCLRTTINIIFLNLPRSRNSPQCVLITVNTQITKLIRIFQDFSARRPSDFFLFSDCVLLQVFSFLSLLTPQTTETDIYNIVCVCKGQVMYGKCRDHKQTSAM